MQIDFNFNRHIRDKPAVQGWIDAYSTVLDNLLTRLKEMKPAYTPSDFPLAKLTDNDLTIIEQHRLPDMGKDSLDDVEDIYPCSSIQQGILISQMKDSALYNSRRIFEIRSLQHSAPDIEKLISAWQQVVNRHAILRTVFMSLASTDGLMYQIILKTWRAEVKTIILSKPCENIEAYLSSQPRLKCQEDRPSHCVTLCKTIEGHLYGALDISHALADASSSNLLINELKQAYDGRLPPTAGPSYGRYIEYMQQMSVEEDLQFWKTSLADAEPCHLPIATDMMKLSTNTPSHVISSIAMTEIVDIRALQRFQERHGITIANIFQLAWALILAQYTNSDRVNYGYLTSGRDVPIEGVLEVAGPMINMMVCSIQLMQNYTVLDALQMVQKQFLEAFEHQRTSLAEIQHALHVTGPLFNTTLSCRREATIDSDIPTSIMFKNLMTEDPTEYDVTINVIMGSDKVRMELHYVQSRISTALSTRILGHLHELVCQLATNEGLQLKDIKGLGAADMEQIKMWNRDIPQAVDTCLHDQVYKQSRARPEATAVCAWDGELTYVQLDAQAEQVAHHLVLLGVGPEVMVGLCMEKSKWAVVAMLAILKAGGAVVPLGIQHPVTRIKGIICDTAATVILVDAGQAQRLAGQAPHLVIVDTALLDRLDSPSGLACKIVRPEHVAWVIYTSGSTGTPKGVVLAHKALCTSIEAHGSTFGMDHDTRILQFAAYTWDVSISDIFGILSFGGCVCIPSEHDRMNNLSSLFERFSVTLVNLTPTVIRMLNPNDCRQLKTLVAGGEALDPVIIERWSLHARIVNSYGPSECSIISTCHSPAEEIAEASIIGNPMNVCLWVVNESNHNLLCPIGAPGELLIEGPQLARGYLNDEKKTAAAFVRDPGFVQQYGLGSGRRMYRTGDLVRQNDDGSLTFFGRRDTQVKIRGQRVEIGEIEYWAAQHPAVRDVIILYPKQGPFENRLVGIIVLHDIASSASYISQIQQPDPAKLAGLSTQMSNLRQHLSRHVMEYMIPTIWVPLTILPLNISSKVDRLQLSQWILSVDPDEIQVITESSTGDASQTPATAIERRLQELWSRVLNMPISRIALDRSFLALGGDSVTAMEIVSYARSQGLQLAVHDVLQSQSISQLAMNVVITGEVTLYEDNAPYDPFPLSPIQQLYFDSISSVSLEAQEGSQYNQTMLLRLTRDVEPAELGRALEAITAKHGMLRARFHRDETLGWRQRVVPELSGSFGFRVHHLVDEEQELYNRLSASERSLDLKNGPVFTADHVQLANRQLLFLAAHHLVVDLVSWRIILRDLEELLHARTLSVPRSLSFRTWCQQQSEFGKHQVSATNVLPFEVPQPNWDYWGLVPGAYLSADTISETMSLNAETTQALFGQCNEPLRTEPVEILLAALFHSFHKCFPDRIVPAIFNEGHGREALNGSIDLSDTVGWFTTMTPVHVPDVGEDIVKTLVWTKECRRQTPGRGLPYFTARYLTKQGQAQFARHDCMEILMNYRGLHRQAEREGALFCLESLSYNKDKSQALSPVASKTRELAVFTIEVTVLAGTTQIDFNFSRYIHHRPEVQEWVRAYPAVLSDLLARLKEMKPTYTPSDFRLARLTDNDLTVIKQHYLPEMGKDTLDDIEDIYPCSAIQQGILISQMKLPTAYGIRQIFEVRSLQDSAPYLEKVISAWQQVVDRHAILRTVFLSSVSSNGMIHQIVLKSWKAEINTIIFSEPCKSIEAYLSGQPRLECREDRPSHRVTLCKTLEGRLFGILDISHTLSDASSINLLISELIQAYDGRLSSTAGPSYGKYIEYLQQVPVEEDLQFWKTSLGDIEPCHLPMATDGMKLTPSTESNNITSMVMAEIVDIQALQRFQETHSVAMANIFQLAWALILAQYTNSDRVNYGYLTNGRDVPIERVLEVAGPMINMMVCSMQLIQDDTVLDAVQKVKKQFLKSFQHQRTSLAEIHHALSVTGPLFNTTLSCKREATAGTGIPASITFENLTTEDPTEYDLNMNINMGSDTIQMALQYIPSRISRAAVARILGHFRELVFKLATNEELQLKDIKGLGTSDIKQIRSWNHKVPPAIHACLHDLVREQSHMQPDVTAVCAWDGELTYGQLDAQAEQVAHYLVTLGVGPEVMVALCMDKSKWAVVAMLAILKAGGAVVPLGTQHPIARIEGVMRDTAATVMLVDAGQAERLAGQALHLVTIDTALLDQLNSPSGQACETVKPENVAWVIYTSGSTGTPKGVVLEHMALHTTLQAHREAFGMSHHTRSLQFSAHMWDVSISDILGTLQFGGCVCVPSEEDRLNRLEEVMQEMKVNFATLTSTVAGLLRPSALPLLKTIILVGEAVKPAVVELWLGHCMMVNAYGPTECALFSTAGPPITDKSQAAIIGHSMGRCLWVVDPLDHNCLCPIGAPGELLIEGYQLARGYLHDAKKTAATFITDPGFVQQYGLGSGRRMYRTGDLVRQNDDGSLTFIGRRDTQIKIRGQRVEIGEIEYWIGRLGQGIRTAAVDLIHRGDDDNEQALLVAVVDFVYFDAGGEEPIEDTQLLEPTPALQSIFSLLYESLSQVLPPYMVPSLYVPIVKLPLNTSCKLDRRAVQALIRTLDEDQLRLYLTTELKESPTTPMEQRLQALWAAVFGCSIEAVGRHDHFFQTGGDSVMAMRMVAAAGDENLALTVADIFKYPQLSDLAREVANRKETRIAEEVAPFELCVDAAEERTVQLEAVAQQCGVTIEQIEDLYPCTPLQEGTFAITGQRKGAYVVQRSFRLNENVNVMQLRTAWEKLVELLAILRTRIIMLPRSGLMQAVIRESIIWKEGQSLNKYLTEDQAMGMGYGNPLVRFALITESQPGGKVERHFVWTAHHSVYDGWSVRKMFELLTSFYRGENVPLSPVPFTRFLRYLKQLDKEDAQAFWCGQLEGMEAAVFPPHPHTMAGSRTRGVLGQQMSGREGGGSETISIILRAAWALVVAQQTGANEALLAVTLSGRTAPVPQILHILAPTVTTVPVRIRIDRTQPVEDFLTAVQQQAADMMPFEHTGLQNIRRLVPDLQNGLDAGHLFVVQAVDEGEAMPPAATIGLEEQISTLGDLEDYALNVVCTTGAADGSIEVVARFDTRVIGEAAVQMLLNQFNHTFQQLVLTDF
jgi:amino acid adenylation domain-containing protein/non-ribosomal peptide synthase protein (TIGR01720 family)